MQTTESYTDPIVLYPEVLEIITRLFEVQNSKKATVFFKLSGHTECLQVYIHAPHWTEDDGTNYDKQVWLAPNKENEVAKFKDELFNYLDTL